MYYLEYISLQVSRQAPSSPGTACAIRGYLTLLDTAYAIPYLALDVANRLRYSRQTLQPDTTYTLHGHLSLDIASSFYYSQQTLQPRYCLPYMRLSLRDCQQQHVILLHYSTLWYGRCACGVMGIIFSQGQWQGLACIPKVMLVSPYPPNTIKN